MSSPRTLQATPRDHGELPDAVEDVSIRVNPQHDVLHGGVVDEGAFRVDEEDVGDPDLLHQSRVKGAALVGPGRKGQPLVLPVVPQVQSHGEVLQRRGSASPHLYMTTRLHTAAQLFSRKTGISAELTQNRTTKTQKETRKLG